MEDLKGSQPLWISKLDADGKPTGGWTFLGECKLEFQEPKCADAADVNFAGIGPDDIKFHGAVIFDETDEAEQAMATFEDDIRRAKKDWAEEQEAILRSCMTDDDKAFFKGARRACGSLFSPLAAAAQITVVAGHPCRPDSNGNFVRVECAVDGCHLASEDLYYLPLHNRKAPICGQHIQKIALRGPTNTVFKSPIDWGVFWNPHSLSSILAGPLGPPVRQVIVLDPQNGPSVLIDSSVGRWGTFDYVKTRLAGSFNLDSDVATMTATIEVRFDDPQGTGSRVCARETFPALDPIVNAVHNWMVASTLGFTPSVKQGPFESSSDYHKRVLAAPVPECDVCYGTGYHKGFGAPCSKGCAARKD